MSGWIWAPGSAVGTTIEIPARAPGVPANLWIHIAANILNWEDLSSRGDVMADWSYSTAYAEVDVEQGDIPVASLACVALAGVQRQEQGIFDSDTWGVALNSMAPTGPGSLFFSGEFATAGLCWPGELWLIADILVLRPSLIPPVPVPYGTYPKPRRPWNWPPLNKYMELVQNVGDLTGEQLKLLRHLNGELSGLLEPDKFENADKFQSPASRPAKLSFKLSVPAARQERADPPRPNDGSRTTKSAGATEVRQSGPAAANKATAERSPRKRK